MRIALIDKDQFSSLLKYGDIILPQYSYRYINISDESSELKAIRSILHDGVPIESPSQYIIVRYEENTDPGVISIESIRSLMATDADGRRLFSTQFRRDLIIEPEKYSEIFSEYLNNEFQKQRIQKGIIAFRKLCKLEVGDDCADYVEKIFRGISNRKKYRHHYFLPAEEREEPYSLMISYDRHAPYPKGWTGYFCDVIETYCYHNKPNLGYRENIAESTDVYKTIKNYDKNTRFVEIYDAIRNERFINKANEYFSLPGGCLVPCIFFILRDRFRNTDSFSSQSKLIEQVKLTFPEAFDTACIFVGGFFGYDRFYDDYYSVLNLPFIKGNGDQPEIPENKLVEEKETENQEQQNVDNYGDTNLLKRDICQAIYECGASNLKKRTSIINIVQSCSIDKLTEIKKLLEEKKAEGLRKEYFNEVKCNLSTFKKICEHYVNLSEEGKVI